MMNTDTSVVQERIGQLSHQFKLPTVAAKTTSRFTEAGHGDTLLQHLEQGWQGVASGASSGCFGNPGCLWARRGRPSSTTGYPGAAPATGPFGPGQFRGARRQRPGRRTARHRQDPRPVRRGPLGRWSRAGRCSWPRPSGRCRICSPPIGTWSCRDNRASSITTTCCCSMTLGTCRRGPRSPRRSSRSSPNATSAAAWASPRSWSSPSGSTYLPLLWPRRLPRPGDVSPGHPGDRRPQLPHQCR